MSAQPRDGAALALSAAMSVTAALAYWPDPERRRAALEAAAREVSEALAACAAGDAGDPGLDGHRLKSMLDGITGLGLRLGPVFTGEPQAPGLHRKGA